MAHDPHAKEKAQYAQDGKWMKDPAYTAWEQIYVDAKGELRPPYVQCTCEPSWADSGWKYRRRPDAPKKCCRLCRHNKNGHCNITGRTVEIIIGSPLWCPLDAEAGKEEHEDEIDRIRKKMENGMKHDNDEITQIPKRIKHTPQECDRGQKCAFVNGGECPDNCPLDAEANEKEKVMAHVDIEIEKDENRSYADEANDAEAKQMEEYIENRCDQRCSTCRHSYEPRPRTIRLDAELPEPESLREFVPSRYPGTQGVKIVLNNEQDARAWYDAIIKAMEKEQVAK